MIIDERYYYKDSNNQNYEVTEFIQDGTLMFIVKSVKNPVRIPIPEEVFIDSNPTRWEGFPKLNPDEKQMEPISDRPMRIPWNPTKKQIEFFNQTVKTELWKEFK